MPMVCAITGGGRGIGYAYALALAERGYCVAIFDIANAAESATKLIESMSNRHGEKENVVGIDCDVSNPESFRSAFNKGLAFFNAKFYDIFVNNAAVMNTLFANTTHQVQVNLLGSMYGTEMAIKAATNDLTRPCSASQGLLVVCTASTNGLIPADCDLAPIYVATKFGIVGFVRSLKPLHSRFNVRVNCKKP
jgi:NAD(P)-dependent dehydrogenase (short-subunit alcohol dehydrogenase family)